MQQLRHILGLDLGPPGDSTGLAVIEFPTQPHVKEKPTYQLRHLERLAAGTPYEDIFESVAACVRVLARPSVVVDQTAVGSVVVRQLRQVRDVFALSAVTLTGGGAVHPGNDGSTYVPKKNLITGLQLVFQSRRLKIAPTLPDADLLSRELTAFRMRPVVLNDDSALWREGRHDDLVFAVALAVWHAERTPSSSFAPYVLGGGDAFSNYRRAFIP